MRYIFEGCSSLRVLNLSNFNTNNYICLDCMFNAVSSKLSLISENIQIKKEYKKYFFNKQKINNKYFIIIKKTK